MCQQGKTESVAHFVSECPAYAPHRVRLHEQVARALECSNGNISSAAYLAMGELAQTRVLLGQRTGDPVAEDRVDTHVKKFLTKAWNVRAGMTAAVNTVMGTSYDVVAPAC